MAMRYTSLEAETCAAKVTIKLLSGKWKPLIIFHLSETPMRFQNLWRAIPSVSKKVLVEQLNQLSAASLVGRSVLNAFPPEVEYSLTNSGSSLAELLGEVEKWGLENLDGVVKIR